MGVRRDACGGTHVGTARQRPVVREAFARQALRQRRHAGLIDLERETAPPTGPPRSRNSHARFQTPWGRQTQGNEALRAGPAEGRGWRSCVWGLAAGSRRAAGGGRRAKE